MSQYARENEQSAKQCFCGSSQRENSKSSRAARSRRGTSLSTALVGRAGRYRRFALQTIKSREPSGNAVTACVSSRTGKSKGRRRTFRRSSQR